MIPQRWLFKKLNPIQAYLLPAILTWFYRTGKNSSDKVPVSVISTLHGSAEHNVRLPHFSAINSNLNIAAKLLSHSWKCIYSIWSLPFFFFFFPSRRTLPLNNLTVHRHMLTHTHSLSLSAPQIPQAKFFSWTITFCYNHFSFSVY